MEKEPEEKKAVKSPTTKRERESMELKAANRGWSLSGMPQP